MPLSPRAPLCGRASRRRRCRRCEVESSSAGASPSGGKGTGVSARRSSDATTAAVLAAALAAATAAAAAALTAAGATTHRRCASCAGSLSDACLDGGSCRSSGRLRPAGGGPSSRPSSSIFADITLKGARGAAAGAACRAAAAATACAPICVAISALSSASSSSRSSSFSSALSSALSSSLSSSFRAARADGVGGVTGQTGSTGGLKKMPPSGPSPALRSLRMQGSLTTDRIGMVCTHSAGCSGALIWMRKSRFWCLSVRTCVPSRKVKETSPRTRRASTWHDSSKGCSFCRSEMASPFSYTTAALSLTAS
mmetsp:Transcript_26857/g.88159  ORF Transcript_26857/g.88159 Transcript_26857/m.88159 type:complete len:311 (-) Transcript_26857:464-1396(-)